MIGSARRQALRHDLDIPDRYQILLIIALGKPVEIVITEPHQPGNDIRYYRDENGTHHVPKRELEELIVHDV